MQTITLNIEPMSQIANGSNEIIAIAQLNINGTYPPNEPIDLILDGSAVFTENKMSKITKLTDILGSVKVSFTDTRPESGNIIAQMSNNHNINDTKNFTFTPEAYIDLSISNDYANVWNDINTIPNESSIIYAVTTVQELDPSVQATLTFQIDDSETAWFVDRTNPAARPRVYTTNVAGGQTIEVGIADSSAESGMVQVSGTTQDMQFLKGATQQFSFDATSSTFCKLALNNNGAEAGGKQMITAMATAFVNAAPAAGKRMYLEIIPNECSACFVPENGITVGNNGKSATGYTDKSGTLSVRFSDKIWETGLINASLADQNIDYDQKYFFFDVPSTLKINLVSLVETTDSSKEWVEFNMAAADGVTQQDLFVDLKDESGTAYTNIPFQIDLTGVGVFALQQPDGVQLSGDRKTALLTTQSDGRTQTVSVVSDAQGLCSANASTPPKELKPDGGHIKSQVHACYFNDPWTTVSNVRFDFPNATERTRLIYANGRHQTGIAVSIQAAGPSGDLINGLLPSWPFQTAKIVDYMSGCELGVADFANWRYTTNPSGSRFNAPIAASGQLEQIAASTIGVQSKNYYITCNDYTNCKYFTYSSGVIITPTGPQVISTQNKGAYGYNIGANAPTAPLMFTNNGIKISPTDRVTINLLDHIVYNTSNISSLGINSYAGPADSQNSNISLYPDNYWRQWDYIIQIGSTAYSSYIFDCILSDRALLPPDFAVAEIRRNIYDYKLYLWPNNIKNKNGIIIQSRPLYIVDTYDVRNISVSNIKDINGAIQMSLFSTFGKIDIGASSYTPINMEIFDQYGNSGLFCIDGSKLPLKYDSSQLANWSFLKDGHVDPQQSSTEGATDGYISTNFYSPNRMRIGHDDTQSFSDYKEVYLNNGDKLIFEDSNQGASKRSYYINNSNYGYINYYDTKNPAVYKINEKPTWFFYPIWENDNFIILSKDNGKSLYAGYITLNNVKTIYAVFASTYKSIYTQFRWTLE
ncbi:hypothetical protein ABE530_17560 [Brucella sp. TWI559]